MSMLIVSILVGSSIVPGAYEGESVSLFLLNAISLTVIGKDRLLLAIQ